MINYNDITVAELDTSSFSKTDKNADFVFNYSDIMPESMQDGTRIFAEADKNTFLQLAERALKGSEYEGYTDTLYITEQFTIDCKQDRDYVPSFEIAMYLGNTPEEAKDNLENDKGNSVPITFEERNTVMEFAVEYAENILDKDFDDLISAEQDNEFDLEI